MPRCCIMISDQLRSCSSESMKTSQRMELLASTITAEYQ